MNGFHDLDFLAIFGNLAVVLYLGRRAAHKFDDTVADLFEDRFCSKALARFNLFVVEMVLGLVGKTTPTGRLNCSNLKIPRSVTVTTLTGV